jgi:hypothetical protein
MCCGCAVLNFLVLLLYCAAVLQLNYLTAKPQNRSTAALEKTAAPQHGNTAALDDMGTLT